MTGGTARLTPLGINKLSLQIHLPIFDIHLLDFKRIYTASEVPEPDIVVVFLNLI